MERRRSERSPVRLAMVLDDETRFQEAETIELGEGGAVVETDGPVGVGRAVKLIPLVTTRAKVLELSGRVVRVDPRLGTGRYRMAMQLELDREELEAVGELLLADESVWSQESSRR